MENEALFAGEPALDAQQLNTRDARRAAAAGAAAAPKDAPLQIHTEPLLAGEDSADEWPHYQDRFGDTDTRPRWRRPHVSDAAYRYIFTPSC